MEEGMFAGVQFYQQAPASAVNFGNTVAAGDDDLHTLIARLPPPRQAGNPLSSASHGSSTSSSGRQQGPSLAGVLDGEHRSCSEIKARIAAHPRYPRLLEAFIDCQKVGAPPEIASLLDEIRRENGVASGSCNASSLLIGADPELDLFMETYCDILAKYKSDLSRPFDEAKSFLNTMEEQLTDLCKASAVDSSVFRTMAGVICPFSAPDEFTGSSDEELSSEVDAREAYSKAEDRDLKDKLLRKYSGYLSSLKQEFSKKKKKGKLPKEARQILLDWWNVHYKWPYPTEADKIALAESTGLDQKQINNWFINQRKRHWKPTESMQFAVMDSLSAPYYFDG